MKALRQMMAVLASGTAMMGGLTSCWVREPEACTGEVRWFEGYTDPKDQYDWTLTLNDDGTAHFHFQTMNWGDSIEEFTPNPDDVERLCRELKSIDIEHYDVMDAAGFSWNMNFGGGTTYESHRYASAESAAISIVGDEYWEFMERFNDR